MRIGVFAKMTKHRTNRLMGVRPVGWDLPNLDKWKRIFSDFRIDVVKESSSSYTVVWAKASKSYWR